MRRRLSLAAVALVFAASLPRATPAGVVAIPVGSDEFYSRTGGQEKVWISVRDLS